MLYRFIVGSSLRIIRGDTMREAQRLANRVFGGARFIGRIDWLPDTYGAAGYDRIASPKGGEAYELNGSLALRAFQIGGHDKVRAMYNPTKARGYTAKAQVTITI